ncbi:translation initiation factor eIF-2B subunit alpha [Thraustotheca clavata]|uniref:Translation initiation factor eIF2B subunit alpha n=1 Tax=Thraustotheca clavata TaxID=74557 RepID=A0A1V9YVZ8_9STRA|nr:translation initiation factor eIF-2B subunit alpha [Thraustotheca clavata]
MAPQVVNEFLGYLKDPDSAIAVAVIKTLTGVIQRCNASTMMEIENALQEAAAQLKAAADTPVDKSITLSSISVTAVCQLFLRYVTRCFLEFADFDQCKAQLIDRGKMFVATSLTSRKRIADLGHNFVRDGMQVLTHGASRVVTGLLLQAAKTKHFSVVVTEGRPNNAGYKTAEVLSKAGIPTTVIVDAAMGYYMEKVDMVIVGAEGVVENGGIVNKIGTFSCAMIAHAMKKPFYVAAESFKFARLYPLNQSDFPHNCTDENVPSETHPNMTVGSPTCDYTPPHYISLLFTDLGVLTPSAVSDELIKLYQ